MAVTAQQVLQVLLYDINEDSGLRLGLLTNQQFLDLLNLCLTDFFKESGLFKRIYTQPVVSGQLQYPIPDDILRVDAVFLAGRWLPPSNVQSLNNGSRNWRTVPGTPKAWHTDEIPLKTIELAPAPNYSSSVFTPVYDDFGATVAGNYKTAPQHRGLSIVGPRDSLIVISALGQTIPLIPDDLALGFLPFAIEQRLFSGDNELKDQQAALFCGAQWKECQALTKAISGEPEDSDAGSR